MGDPYTGYVVLCESLTSKQICEAYGCTWTEGNPDVLVEYYASGSSCASTTVNCKDLYGTTCQNGACVGECTGCLIGGTCYNNGAVNPNNPCQYCDVSKSTNSWSNVDDGTPCTKNCVPYTAECKAGVCECKSKCTSTAKDCADGYCCTDDPSGPGDKTNKCIGKGIYSANPRYLCDPPEWSESEKGAQDNQSNYSILDFILNFFRSIFS